MILHIDSSITGVNSVTRPLSAAIVERLRAARPDAEICYRDLAADPIPHLTLAAFAEPAIVDEFLAADTIVLGAPMYNFGIASNLKAWLDHVAIPGKAFRYTETGPVGLSGGRKVIVASARGGFYGADTPQAAADHQERYMRTLLGFLGVDDITFVHAEGVAIGPEARAQAIENAAHAVATLAL